MNLNNKHGPQRGSPVSGTYGRGDPGVVDGSRGDPHKLMDVRGDPAKVAMHQARLLLTSQGKPIKLPRW